MFTIVPDRGSLVILDYRGKVRTGYGGTKLNGNRNEDQRAWSSTYSTATQSGKKVREGREKRFGVT